jgi:hypothetical protein
MTNQTMQGGKIGMKEMEVFLSMVELLHKEHEKDFASISSDDVQKLISWINEYSVGIVNEEQEYESFDPIMNPLVQTAMANLVYMKHKEVPNINAFKPNQLRYEWIESLVKTLKKKEEKEKKLFSSMKLI